MCQWGFIGGMFFLITSTRWFHSLWGGPVPVNMFTDFGFAHMSDIPKGLYIGDHIGELKVDKLFFEKFFSSRNTCLTCSKVFTIHYFHTVWSQRSVSECFCSLAFRMYVNKV